MIRYTITDNDLHARIDLLVPNWRTRAGKRTNALATGARKKITGMWSEIKKVYMDLQGPKCAFCEKWIEGLPIERDVEHFRPKNRVKPWRLPKSLDGEGIVVSQRAHGTEDGYRLLAYCPLNYIAACKSCNSLLKLDFFPIAGTRASVATNPRTITGEQPFLIYPLSDVDDDPEELIHFHGLIPQPRRGGFDRQRALVTIRVFELDGIGRPDLLHDRAETLEKLYYALKERDRPSSTQQEIDDAIAAISRLTSSRARHTNCMKSYERLWNTNHPEAIAIYENIKTYLKTKS